MWRANNVRGRLMEFGKKEMLMRKVEMVFFHEINPQRQAALPGVNHEGEMNRT